MMNPENAFEILKWFTLGVDELAADGTLADTEWDTEGLIPGSRGVLLKSGTFGDTGTGGLAAVSVHASDTSGFTPGSGNVVRELTGSDLPAEADDNKVWGFKLPKTAGRYVQVIVTANSGDTADVSVTGCGVPFEGPASAADRGLEKFVDS